VAVREEKQKIEKHGKVKTVVGKKAVLRGGRVSIL
jgi:hypothetical protein